MIRAYLAAAALVALAGLGWWAHHSIWTSGYEAARAEQMAAALVFEQAARAKEQQLQTKLQEAQDAAKKRESVLRADAGRARAQSDGLRGDLEAIRMQLPELAAAACRQRADTIAELFSYCVRDYQGLAVETDRLESERQTLIDAWPR